MDASHHRRGRDLAVADGELFAEVSPILTLTLQPVLAYRWLPYRVIPVWLAQRFGGDPASTRVQRGCSQGINLRA